MSEGRTDYEVCPRSVPSRPLRTGEAILVALGIGGPMAIFYALPGDDPGFPGAIAVLIAAVSLATLYSGVRVAHGPKWGPVWVMLPFVGIVAAFGLGFVTGGGVLVPALVAVPSLIAFVCLGERLRRVASK